MSGGFSRIGRPALQLYAGLSLALGVLVVEAAAPAPAPAQVVSLLQQCTAAMPQAHPWRARQLRQAMFRMRVSMSYRAAAGQLSAAERHAAMAAERDSYDLLFDTCRPLLI